MNPKEQEMKDMASEIEYRKQMAEKLRKEQQRRQDQCPCGGTFRGRGASKTVFKEITYPYNTMAHVRVKTLHCDRACGNTITREKIADSSVLSEAKRRQEKTFDSQGVLSSPSEPVKTSPEPVSEPKNTAPETPPMPQKLPKKASKPKTVKKAAPKSKVEKPAKKAPAKKTTTKKAALKK